MSRKETPRPIPMMIGRLRITCALADLYLSTNPEKWRDSTQ